MKKMRACFVAMCFIDFVKCVILCAAILAILPPILPKRQGRFADMRARAMNRRMNKSLCYDLLGCFENRTKHLSLKRPPEPPSVIQTQFFLYTREERQNPESLQYGDEFNSIVTSRFNATKNLKVLIHGFKGSGSDVGAVISANLLLDLEDANVIVLDWTRGAGTSYGAAVANTELVGRQLALVLLDAIMLGTDPRKIHAIGFSLGAHVAGCASEVLKLKKLLLGRITALDPASPFFRHHLFREQSRKLDATDAHLVDVVHTDGSTDFADGFGLLKPIGHIDFFPNGGREQPGCTDVKNSVVVSHLKDERLDRSIACSHIRSLQYFMESLQSQQRKCKFASWPCPQGALSFAKGTCFPMESTEWSQELGYAANQGPLGIYYLVTRAEEPYCGTPLRTSVTTSADAPKTVGYLFLKILLEKSTTTFRIHSTLPKRNNGRATFYNIVAAEYEGLPGNSTMIRAIVWYEVNTEGYDEDEFLKDGFKGEVLSSIFLDKITVETRKGQRWMYCNRNTGVTSKQTYIELYNTPCVI